MFGVKQKWRHFHPSLRIWAGFIHVKNNCLFSKLEPRRRLKDRPQNPQTAGMNGTGTHMQTAGNRQSILVSWVAPLHPFSVGKCAILCHSVPLESTWASFLQFPIDALCLQQELVIGCVKGLFFFQKLRHIRHGASLCADSNNDIGRHHTTSISTICHTPRHWHMPPVTTCDHQPFRKLAEFTTSAKGRAISGRTWDKLRAVAKLQQVTPCHHGHPACTKKGFPQAKKSKQTSSCGICHSKDPWWCAKWPHELPIRQKKICVRWSAASAKWWPQITVADLSHGTSNIQGDPTPESSDFNATFIHFPTERSLQCCILHVI